VRASLPLDKGIILDPFMGSGSTVAAAEALGLACIGVERFADYFEMSRTAIPRLAQVQAGIGTQQLDMLDLFEPQAL
jgi:site-specific DNA-methyltransferase (adenine-specific)